MVYAVDNVFIYWFQSRLTVFQTLLTSKVSMDTSLFLLN